MKENKENNKKLLLKKLKSLERKKLLPIHPGEILREELLIPRNISPQELAQALKVPKEQIQWICEERGDITPDLATC
jgi:plasmid maintenance system antidote protein VapI